MPCILSKMERTCLRVIGSQCIMGFLLFIWEWYAANFNLSISLRCSLIFSVSSKEYRFKDINYYNGNITLHVHKHSSISFTEYWGFLRRLIFSLQSLDILDRRFTFHDGYLQLWCIIMCFPFSCFNLVLVIGGNFNALNSLLRIALPQRSK